MSGLSLFFPEKTLEVTELRPFGYKISNLEVADLFDLDIVEVQSLLKKSGVLLLDQIKISPQDLKNFCERFSPLESTDPFKSEGGIDGVLRVTSEKDSAGNPLGIFGQKTPLGWHANRPSSLDRKSIVCTYSDEGCDGSQTWWANSELFFKSLDDRLKQVLRKMEGYFGYKENSYTNEKYKPHINSKPWPLVVNRFGRDTLYFPFNQIVKYRYKGKEFEENELTKELSERLTNSTQFRYKHQWSGHQIILSDQWTTIHCRPKCEMEGRKILRLTFNYTDDRLPF